MKAILWSCCKDKQSMQVDTFCEHYTTSATHPQTPAPAEMAPPHFRHLHKSLLPCFCVTLFTLIDNIFLWIFSFTLPRLPIEAAGLYPGHHNIHWDEISEHCCCCVSPAWVGSCQYPSIHPSHQTAIMSCSVVTTSSKHRHDWLIGWRETWLKDIQLGIIMFIVKF